MTKTKAILGVFGGLGIAGAALVLAVNVTGTTAKADPARVAAVEQASAAALLAAFERLPRKAKSCDSARVAGADLLSKPAAWAYWCDHALFVYCGGAK